MWARWNSLSVGWKWRLVVYAQLIGVGCLGASSYLDRIPRSETQEIALLLVAPIGIVSFFAGPIAAMWVIWKSRELSGFNRTVFLGLELLIFVAAHMAMLPLCS